MRLYLAQHGDALDKSEDPRRPLSEVGRADVQRVADFLGAQRGPLPEAVLHSGKDRARETAEILAARLAPGLTPQPAHDIGPTDPVPPFQTRLADWEEDTLVVGHLPFLGRLAGLLVAGDEERAVAAFHPGTVLALEPEPNHGDHWQVVWMVDPELLP